MKTLKRRLTALYTITTGAILFVVILSFLLSSIHKTQNAQLEQFHLIWNSLSSRFLSANAFSHGFLAQTEADYHMIIHIRENGNAFLYPGSWTPPDHREWLIAQTRKMAEAQGVFMDRAPVSSTFATSSLLSIQGMEGDNYYAMVLAVPTRHGVKSLCAIAWIPSISRTLGGTFLYLSLLFLLGLFSLWLVGRQFVGWSLIPIEENQKKQAQFIAAASHELRSPLAVLRSGIFAALSSPEKKDTLLPLMDRECVRMSRLIDDMLLLASADAKSWKLQWETVDMDTLFIDLLESFQPVCREKGIFLKPELPEASLPAISGDSQRIRQILEILLDNACRFTPAGKSVILKAGADAGKSVVLKAGADTGKSIILKTGADAGKSVIRKAGVMLHAPTGNRQYILLQVIDEGGGIAPKDRPYIFDRFYQADSARSDKNHFGLGLSIARELTELHGGKIQAGEDEKGRCCFTVSLPVLHRPSDKYP